ncbi:MAG TPA: hypothetical protein VJX72_05695 [Candidatus Acidoferrum sp.]|nr:hypothetical protein [Candidatus Acidoferrum sp.]
MNLSGNYIYDPSGAVTASVQTHPPPQELRDFDARCHAPGVLVCQGFDSPSDFARAKSPGSGLYPAADETIRGTMDTNVKASGKASLRFEIPSHSPANAAGYWKQNIGREFGEGSTFYVQFRQRFSKEMLKNDWGDTSWKQVIFHNSRATCADVELTTGQYYRAGFPIMYTDCGGRMIATNAGVPPYKLEQGDYNCWYSQYNAKNCFYYPVGEWVTFYYQISIGHWGKADSNIQAWAALDGQTYKQWIKMPNFILRNENPGKDYDTVTLLTYMTRKSMLVSHPTAYTWYDDLIVSTEPIAPPVASEDDTSEAPAAPK